MAAAGPRLAGGTEAIIGRSSPLRQEFLVEYERPSRRTIELNANPRENRHRLHGKNRQLIDCAIRLSSGRVRPRREIEGKKNRGKKE